MRKSRFIVIRIWMDSILKQTIWLGVLFLAVACTRNLPPTTPAPPTALSAEANAPAQPQTEPNETAIASQTGADAPEGEIEWAARVNDQLILLETYQKQVSQFEQTLVSQGVDPNSAEGQAAIRQVQRQVLDALVDQAIIEQAAMQLGITISEETLESKVQESIAQGQGQAQFEAWLVANQLSLPEFKETLRFQLIANQLFEQVTAEIPATAEQIQLRQILVGDEATARQIIEQLKTGADFAELATTYSLDQSNRENGGSLGWFPRGANLVPPEIEEIAFSLQVNEVSGPIKTPLGFHIIQLEAKEAERLLTPEMLPVLKEQRFRAWLVERRSSESIEKFVTP